MWLESTKDSHERDQAPLAAATRPGWLANSRESTPSVPLSWRSRSATSCALRARSTSSDTRSCSRRRSLCNSARSIRACSSVFSFSLSACSYKACDCRRRSALRTRLSCFSWSCSRARSASYRCCCASACIASSSSRRARRSSSRSAFSAIAACRCCSLSSWSDDTWSCSIATRSPNASAAARRVELSACSRTRCSCDSLTRCS
mmetsp:Transcript_20734/g.46395  ORF Transcript_20734/g.46395 Transcript_20734/m.46395 type:complete len:204 (-) Transcript_20734:1628-2239(-)